MTSVDAFRAASEAVERWCGLLIEVGYWAERAESPDDEVSREDAAGVAFVKLYQLRWELDRHGPAIDAEADRLAHAHTPDPVIRHYAPSGELVSYDSAHRAVADVARQIVFVLLDCAGLGRGEPPDDWRERTADQLARHWQSFGLDCSLLRVCVRRERGCGCSPRRRSRRSRRNRSRPRRPRRLPPG